MADIRESRRALVKRLVEGQGQVAVAQRRAALEGTKATGPLAALLDKVAVRASTITDGDVAAVRATGLSEDEVFELVVCAAVGQATRQYESALAALDAAGVKE